MKQTTQIVALRTVRHSDRHSILTAYSRELGRIAFAIPAGNGREASRRRALLMPLSLIECVADIAPGRDIHRMYDPRSIAPLVSLRSHPIKSSIAMFMAEVLGAVLRDGPPDRAMHDFICHTVLALESLPGTGLANFHIYFLYSLGKLLGIAPDTEGYSEGMVFDMIDGRFRRSIPNHRHYLTSERASAVYLFSRMRLETMDRFKMSRNQRNELTDRILDYYSMHYTALGGLKSLNVVRDLF